MGLSWRLETFFEHRNEDRRRSTIVAEPARSAGRKVRWLSYGTARVALGQRCQTALEKFLVHRPRAASRHSF